MKKILLFIFLCSYVVVLVLCFSSKVSADSGTYSKRKDTNNGNLVLSNSGTWKDNGSNGWCWGDLKTSIEGESHLYWFGNRPYNADNIIITNTVSVDKVCGSFTVGTSAGYPSGVGVNTGISVNSTSTSTSYTYSVSNKWQNNVYYEYNSKVGGFWIVANVYFETSSVTQVGSSFYQQTTGEISVSK